MILPQHPAREFIRQTMGKLYKVAAKLDKEVWREGMERYPSYTMGYASPIIEKAIQEAYDMGLKDGRYAEATEPDEGSLDYIDPQPHLADLK